MHISFVLTPNFDLTGYCLAVDLLRDPGQRLGLGWDTRTLSRGPVRASNGAIVEPDAPMWAMPPAPDLVFVFAGAAPVSAMPAGFRDFLARALRFGADIGGCGGGAVLLGQLGYLTGCRVALPASVAAPDGCELVADMHSLDAGRLTARDGLGVIPALKHWLDMRGGVSEAQRHAAPRVQATAPGTAAPRDTEDPVVAQLAALVDRAPERPLAEMAHQIGLSPKQLRLRCQKAVGCAPRDFVSHLRLMRSAHLLRTTEIAVADIATICAFRSPAAFARAFRAKFGTSPRDFRADQRQAAAGSTVIAA